MKRVVASGLDDVEPNVVEPTMANENGWRPIDFVLLGVLCGSLTSIAEFAGRLSIAFGKSDSRISAHEFE